MYEKINLFFFLINVYWTCYFVKRNLKSDWIFMLFKLKLWTVVLKIIFFQYLFLCIWNEGNNFLFSKDPIQNVPYRDYFIFVSVFFIFLCVFSTYDKEKFVTNLKLCEIYQKYYWGLCLFAFLGAWLNLILLRVQWVTDRRPILFNCL